MKRRAEEIERNKWSLIKVRGVHYSTVYSTADIKKQYLTVSKVALRYSTVHCSAL